MADRLGEQASRVPCWVIAFATACIVLVAAFASQQPLATPPSTQQQLLLVHGAPVTYPAEKHVCCACLLMCWVLYRYDCAMRHCAMY